MNSGTASGADGGARRRLPITGFVPASKRRALVLSWGSEHLAARLLGRKSARQFDAGTNTNA
jgi:hypothetical protein